MNLRDLEYFKYLAESLSFTKTAEHFFVSQPSISIALKRLEDEFNSTLIKRNRSTKHIQITPSGQLLYQRTIEMLNLFNNTKTEIANLNSQNVYFGFLPTIGGAYFTRILPYLTEFISDLKLVEEESSDEMLQLIRTRKVPAAIVGLDGSPLHERWLTQYEIDAKPLSVCVSTTHPLAKYSEISAEQLAGQSFLSLSKGYLHHKLFTKWASENNIDTTNVLYTDEIPTAHSIIASGIRVGLMIDTLVKDRTDIIAIPLKDSPLFYINLVLNNETDQIPAQLNFNAKLIEAVEKEFDAKPL
ncbi:LysR family transcriptional regulator [Fundicoccus culcitae]|uniref:LysR family transcriptional regulator n=1 Tax=Fundicoccus culcitae TaxID=2969821 RepID=A0ABY5P3D7_9LACT|nr:LysR family transcriptional regulator [Fundicoccus culcitae]UUX33121.1 LysR family transcriptional regulator [Fundicoccus culcitae]